MADKIVNTTESYELEGASASPAVDAAVPDTVEADEDLTAAADTNGAFLALL